MEKIEKTHVEVDSSFKKCIGRMENIFKDNIGFVEHYDFSKANLNYENRIGAVSTVASICYQSPKAAGSINLFDRLACESASLPSSSFEFVPVLLTEPEIAKLYFERKIFITENNPLTKFGEWIFHKGNKYLLTNYRAVVNLKETHPLLDFTNRYNTEEECKIIAEYFKVFLFKVDIPTRAQMVRHRISWQELSRRYVSGKRVPFEIYTSEKMLNLAPKESYINSESLVCYEDVIEECVRFYYYALDQGIKPQEARRMIPQAGYTLIWGAFQPTQLENYFKLRLDSHAQWEIQQTSIAMKSLISGSKK